MQPRERREWRRHAACAGVEAALREGHHHGDMHRRGRRQQQRAAEPRQAAARDDGEHSGKRADDAESGVKNRSARVSDKDECVGELLAAVMAGCSTRHT